jgi:hypothetical protein
LATPFQNRLRPAVTCIKLFLMSTVAEIEQAIEKLDPKEIRRVGDWLDELRERLFDERIEADAKAGKLDKLMEEAKQDYLAGRCKPLP